MKYHAVYASHIPLLIKTFYLSSGPILEMGMGPFSTPILHWLCFEHERHLVSYDNDPNYFEMNKDFEAAFHEVHLVNDWDEAKIENIHWGLAFIDQKPAIRRKDDVRRLANNADYIVIHDSEISQKHHYNYEEIYPLFKYKYVYRKVKPHTTVLSNFKEFREFKF
jgi:hypothetical protein